MRTKLRPSYLGGLETHNQAQEKHNSNLVTECQLQSNDQMGKEIISTESKKTPHCPMDSKSLFYHC